MESSPQSPSSSCAYLSVSSNECVPQSPMSADSLVWERVERVNEPSLDFEMASMISEGNNFLSNIFSSSHAEARHLSSDIIIV